MVRESLINVFFNSTETHIDISTRIKTSIEIQSQAKAWVYNRGSQLISTAGYKGPKPVHRYMYEGQMDTIVDLGIYGYLCTRVGYVIYERVPGFPYHLDLRRNQRFLWQKQDRNKICRNFCISESEMYQSHKLTYTEIQFFWNVFIIILFIYHNLIQKSQKASWNVSKRATFLCLHWDSGNPLSEFIPASRYHRAGTLVPGYFCQAYTIALGTSLHFKVDRGSIHDVWRLVLAHTEPVQNP